MSIRKLNGYPVELSEEELKEFDVLVYKTGSAYHLAMGKQPLCNRHPDAEKVENPLLSDSEPQFKNRDEPNFCSECLAEVSWGDKLKSYQRRGL
jgi:hypothetical protein